MRWYPGSIGRYDELTDPYTELFDRNTRAPVVAAKPG